MSAVVLQYDVSSLPVSWVSPSSSPVTDQGRCDNSWVVSAAAVAQDRISLAHNRQGHMYNSNDVMPVFVSLVRSFSLDVEALQSEAPCGAGGRPASRAWRLLTKHGSDYLEMREKF